MGVIRSDAPELHHRCDGDVECAIRLLGQLLGPLEQVKGGLGNLHGLNAGIFVDRGDLRLGQVQGKHRFNLPDLGFHAGVDGIRRFPVPFLFNDRIHGIGDADRNPP